MNHWHIVEHTMQWRKSFFNRADVNKVLLEIPMFADCKREECLGVIECDNPMCIVEALGGI
jgi:hypothetical protein